MDARAQSIDHAASGYLRRQFMRAFGASWNVLLVAGLLGAIGWAMATTDLELEGVAMTLIGAPLILLIVLAMFLIPVVLSVALVSAIADAVHRRLVALAMLALALAGLVLSPLALFGAVAALAGAAQPQASEPMPPWQLAVMAAMLVLTALLALEALLWSWWQLTASKEGFMAARGWRPPVWRLLSTFRRHLGLPAFLASFARGRLSLSVLYFFVAVLNAGLAAALILSLLAFAPEEGPKADNADILLGAAIMGALLLANLLGLGAFIDRIADARAVKLYQRVREWDARPPIVFLRAFDQDDAKLPALTRDPFVKALAGVGAARTLDEILLENGAPYGPLIAIGDPRDPTPPLGAARVFVPGEDRDWQSVVSALVAASKCVVMCPTTSAGVKWELELLDRTGATARTIFLANPEIPVGDTEPLFATLFLGGGRFPEIRRGQTPIAAFQDPKRGWRVLTARRRSQQAYVIALNMALQAMFGPAGVPAMRPRKARLRESEKPAPPARRASAA